MTYAKTFSFIFLVLILSLAACRTANGTNPRIVADQHSTEIARIEDAISSHGKRIDTLTTDIIARAGSLGTTAGDLENLLQQYFRAIDLILHDYRRLQEYIRTKEYKFAELDQVYSDSNRNLNSINPP